MRSSRCQLPVARNLLKDVVRNTSGGPKVAQGTIPNAVSYCPKWEYFVQRYLHFEAKTCGVHVYLHLDWPRDLLVSIAVG